MDEKQNAAQEWLETATKGIRFGPDRLAVEAELLEHLEDKTADMARMKEKWKTWRKRLKERREEKKPDCPIWAVRLFTVWV